MINCKYRIVSFFRKEPEEKVTRRIILSTDRSLIRKIVFLYKILTEISVHPTHTRVCNNYIYQIIKGIGM